MFTQYKMPISQATDEAIAAAGNAAKLVPETNPVLFAAKTIAERLRKRPDCYVEFGPYWWSVKQALRSLGFDLGANDDPMIRAEYAGTWPAYTCLVAGESFKDMYRQNFLGGTSSFWLDADGVQPYELFDDDMEARKLGGPGIARVIASMSSVPESGDRPEPMLDGAAPQVPYAVKFEHNNAVWTAQIYAHDLEDAYQRVKMKQPSIAAAIEGRLLDSADLAPLLVDQRARTVLLPNS